MQHYRSLKEHYQFTNEEAQTLKELQPRMEKLADKFIDGFYDYIWGFGKTAQFLKNKDIIIYHRKKIKEWFINLFGSVYIKGRQIIFLLETTPNSSSGVIDLRVSSRRIQPK